MPSTATSVNYSNSNNRSNSCRVQTTSTATTEYCFEILNKSQYIYGINSH